MMHHEFDGSGECPCGTVKLRVSKPPMMRFYCHCKICQGVYKKPYADATVFWAKDVEITDPSLVQFKRHRPPPNLNRGICSSCHSPAVGLMTLVPGVKLAFVPTHMFVDKDALQPAALHIFYGKRVEDVQDALPKYNGYWGSQLAFSRLLTPKLFAR